MHHVAIMKKSWGLLPRILTGEKVIESRWYMNRARPWGKINAGDTVYFKNSGEPVTVVAKVSNVIQFELDRGSVRGPCPTGRRVASVREILDEYGLRDGIGKQDIQKYFELFKNKRYCLMIFLKNPKTVKPFEISKKGFGAMSAWITVGDVESIKI